MAGHTKPSQVTGLHTNHSGFLRHVPRHGELWGWGSCVPSPSQSLVSATRLQESRSYAVAT